MLSELKERVLVANLELYARNLAIYTWGNVSGFDQEKGLVVIKPSGVPREELTLGLMVVVDLAGQVVEGSLRPSTDTPTHLVLYQNFPGIGGIAHTHSPYATAWAQAGLGLPCLGTTHADHFPGEVPCTRPLTKKEIEGDYEANTGWMIVKRFRDLNPVAMPAALAANHGPFTWGTDPDEAVRNSVVLEEVARMALATKQLRPSVGRIGQALLDRHFRRKHGAGAYYGQDTDKSI